MHKTTKGVSEWSRQDSNFLADREIVIQVEDSRGLRCGYQRLDYATGYRDRLFDSRDQRGDAESAVYAAPPVFRKIKYNKDVPGEELGQNVL